MRHQGKITTWKDDKGFGFITPNGGGEPVFLHVSSRAGAQRPAPAVRGGLPRLAGVMAGLGRLPLGVLGLYAAASVVAFLAYGHDKSATVRDAWRVKENTLHPFALLGGWPGALAAQVPAGSGAGAAAFVPR